MNTIFIVYNVNSDQEYGYYSSQEEAEKAINQYKESYEKYEFFTKMFSDAWLEYKEGKINSKDYDEKIFAIRNSEDMKIYDAISKITLPRNLAIKECKFNSPIV